MAGDDMGRLIYLVLLGAAVVGWLLMQGREARSKMVQQAAIWGLIFLGTIAAVGLWSDIRRTTLALPEIAGDTITIPRSRDGHFHLTLDINGAAVPFVVDTGATNIVLSRSDARQVGIDPDSLRYLGEAQTANGIVRTARVKLDEVRLGDLQDRNLTAYVTDGAQEGSLLGMDYLRRFPELTIRGNELVLRR